MDTPQESQQEVSPDESYASQLYQYQQIGNALRIRVKNDNHQHAYVTLLDPNFQKPYVFIDIPIMDDPTIGHLEKYSDFCRSLKNKKITIGCVYMWCPALVLHLDLFTLHIYNSTPAKENPYAFSNLIILPSRADPFQQRTDIIFWTEPKFTLLASSRIALIVPAHSTMLIDLYPDKIEKDDLVDLPI